MISSMAIMTLWFAAMVPLAAAVVVKRIIQGALDFADFRAAHN